MAKEFVLVGGFSHGAWARDLLRPRYAARLGVAPVELDTAHNPMVSAPDALATILERI